VSSAVIVGGSSGIGRSLARALAARGTNVLLIARTKEDLSATASDLTVRFGIRAAWIAMDISQPELDAEALARRCVDTIGDVHAVYLPAGAVSDDDLGPNPAAVDPMTAVNFTGPAKIAAAFGKDMAARGSGTIVFFSSIAAAAPRRKNVAYSAAKAALEVYAKGLRHDLEPKGVRVAVVAPGYVDTRLSYGMALRFPVASPDQVADFVVARELRGRHYYPRFWGWITWVLRHLPWSIYRRLSF
jgi:decaprenylphospho-beta-D-erythro-pentofuranosid-2-ulose 2-reductase